MALDSLNIPAEKKSLQLAFQPQDLQQKLFC
jgi:hypothetical protein